MQPCEKRAAKPVRPRPRASADLLGAIETIISALAEIAGYEPIASREFLNYGEVTATRTQLADLQPTIVVCAHEDGLTLVKRGRAVFAREYMLQLMETMAGLMAEGKRSLGHPSSQLDVAAGVPGCGSQPLTDNCFLKKGMYWTLSYQGKETLVADGKGLHYLARLLRYPGREVHVLDLAACSEAADASLAAMNMRSAAAMPSSKQSTGTLRASSLGDAGVHLDGQAKSAYKRRLAELREDLEGAKQCGNEQHALALEEEIDALIGELRRATGLRGRDRRAASATERARINVTRTIRLAVERIGRVHAELENHLMASVKTGAFCRYQPDPDELLTWQV